MTNPSGATSSFSRSGIPQTPLALGAAATRKQVSEYLDSLLLEEEQRMHTYRSLCNMLMSDRRLE